MANVLKIFYRMIQVVFPVAVQTFFKYTIETQFGTIFSTMKSVIAKGVRRYFFLVNFFQTSFQMQPENLFQQK